MKTLSYLFVMVILLIAGCAKEDSLFETQDNLELKHAKVPIPFKAEGRIVADPLMPGLYWMNGVGSHIGKIDEEQSYYQITSAVPTIIDGENYRKLGGFGKIVGANGNGMEFTFWSNQNDTQGTWKGQVSVTPGSGTGRFKNCTGMFESEGVIDEAGASFGSSFVITGELNFNQEHEMRSAKVPIPFTAVCRAVYHLDIPGRLIISGNATHAGKINAKESYYQVTSMVPAEIDGQQYMRLEGFGKIVGANGHGMEFTFWSYQTLDYSSFQGQVIITPGTGTGQFKDCTGTLNSSGGIDVTGDFAFMTITGSLVFEN